MLNQKVQNLLLVAVIAIPITTVTYLLTSGSNGVAAQVQGLPGLHSAVTELPSDERQEADPHLSYQGIYTNPNTLNLPGDVELEEAHLEGVDDFSSSEIDPQSTNSGSEFVPASAFRSDGSPGAAVGYRFSVLGVPFPGGFVYSISTDYVCMVAPVYLPDGASVTEFSIYFMDDHPTLDFDTDNIVKLWRKDHAFPNNAANELASITTNGLDSTTIIRRSDTSIANANVSNDFGYYITFCFDQNSNDQHLVYGFGVDYNP
jgi:hypothetical protein